MTSKDIEEKAILALKNYIWGSKVISQFIAENDKEPFWDGYVNLYKDSQKDKKSFLGRVPLQIKGKLVRSFKKEKFKYNIDVTDLKAYLADPTVYIVCQMKEDSKDTLLYYRNLLPETIKNLLKGKDKQKTIAVKMKPFPESLESFESILRVFIGDSRKQISYSGMKSLTLEDARKRKVNNFSFVMPLANMSPADCMGYLSSHDSYMYAQVDKDLGIEIPISGEMNFSFTNLANLDVVVGERIFYNQFCNEIKDGNLVVNVGNVLTLSFPINQQGKNSTASFKVSSDFLDESMHQMEFLMALDKEGKVKLGGVEIKLKVNEPEIIQECGQRLIALRQLKHVLDLLHVTKPLDLSKIDKEQNDLIEVLIATIEMGKPIRIGHSESTLTLAEIGNLNLLLWESVDKDGNSFFGDFFDGRIDIKYQFEAGKHYESSPFSYLQNNNLWSKCDNIPFDKQIDSYSILIGRNPHIYDMANLDLLAMLNAYDSLDETEQIKRDNILAYAKKLNEWLSKSESTGEKGVMHFVNYCQILKRRGCLTDECIEGLRKLLLDETVMPMTKVGVSLLLGEKDTFNHCLDLCKDDVENLKRYPIWKFYSDLK